MNIADLKNSKYLTKRDFVDEQLGTIREVVIEAVGQPGDQEEKAVAYFEEWQKGMVLNQTNLETIAAIAHSEETDDWVGVQILIFADETIRFGGRTVGGIRVRAARPPGTGPVRRPPLPAPNRARAALSAPARQPVAARQEPEMDNGEGTDLGPQVEAKIRQVAHLEAVRGDDDDNQPPPNVAAGRGATPKAAAPAPRAASPRAAAPRTASPRTASPSSPRAAAPSEATLRGRVEDDPDDQLPEERKDAAPAAQGQMGDVAPEPEDVIADPAPGLPEVPNRRVIGIGAQIKASTKAAGAK